ncbi:hypothetical protein A1D31_22210 [Bradyrhizobium liaoningense]|nr:hypothetical protein A1D31_22210 [Bradyrhizobium liaoningense]
MTFQLDPDNDPNEAYGIRAADVPPGWWEVTANGIGVHYFKEREKAERFCVDPEYRKELCLKPKLWERKPT